MAWSDENHSIWPPQRMGNNKYVYRTVRIKLSYEAKRLVHFQATDGEDPRWPPDQHASVGQQRSRDTRDVGKDICKRQRTACGSPALFRIYARIIVVIYVAYNINILKC